MRVPRASPLPFAATSHDGCVVFEQRDRAESFGADALRYDRARPTYPAELIDDLVAEDPDLVVDVGCGTGIVGRLLAERGCRVVGIEPDERMAAVARQGAAEVEVTRFEQWDARDRTFDLLTSGQAWHWVDPARGAAEVLRSGARFGVFWNGLHHSAEMTTGFQEIYRRLAPNLFEDSVALGTTKSSGDYDAAAFRATGEFVDLEIHSYAWQRRYTTAQWLDELPTHSHILPADRLDKILDAVGRLIDVHGGELAVDYRTAGTFGRRR